MGWAQKFLELLLHSGQAPGAYGANRFVATRPFAWNPLVLTSARLNLEEGV